MKARPNSGWAELGQLQRQAHWRIHSGCQRGAARGNRVQDQAVIHAGTDPVRLGRLAIDGNQGITARTPLRHHADQFEAAGGVFNQSLWRRRRLPAAQHACHDLGVGGRGFGKDQCRARIQGRRGRPFQSPKSRAGRRHRCD